MQKNNYAYKTQHDLLKIVGPGAKQFLQGQLSADMEKLDSVSPALLLSPEGKLVSCLNVISRSDYYILETASGFGKATKERLERFFIGADCEMEMESCSGIAVIANQDLDENLDLLGEMFCIKEEWGENVSRHHFLDLDNSFDFESASSLPLGAEEDFDYLRIYFGIPKLGAELDTDRIAAEAGQKFIDERVSFDKGCFVGQELVARIDSRGSNTPQKLAILHITIEEKNTNAEIATTQNYELSKDGKSIGKITSLAKIPEELPDFIEKTGDFVALAYIKRNLELEGEQILEISPLVEGKAQGKAQENSLTIKTKITILA